MSTTDSLTPSLTRKVVFTTTLALLALAYTRPARSLEQGVGEMPVACSPGNSSMASIERVAVHLPARARERAPLHHVTPLQVAMQTSFDPASHLVKLALQPKDSANTFISNLRPDDFVVYENGTRQTDITVTVKRPPVTLGILIEHGGRYQMLNEGISEATSSAAQQFLGEMRPGDRVAIWSYDDKLHEVTGFSQQRDALLNAFQKIDGPLPLSESNLYDALIGALAQMQKMSGPKALLVISSGIDTFSRASLGDALRAAECSDVPVYAIDIAEILRQEVFEASDSGPYGELGWNRARESLARIASMSGGRMYIPESVLDLPGDYDDLMEDARARYLITYHSQSTEPRAVARTVRVEIRPKGGAGPLRVATGKGRSAMAMISLQGTYVPTSVVAENAHAADTAKIAKSGGE